VVANDFLWPRLLADRVRGHARERHLRVVGEAFVGVGTGEFGPVLDQVAASEADGVAVLLVGDDAVSFNRAFADRGLDEAFVRFSPLVEENLLAAIGAGGTRGLSSAAGYFESLVTPEALAFGGRYAGRFGPEAPPLNALGEAHYEAVHLLACLAHTAGTIDVGALSAVSDTAVYEGPRGPLKMRSAHLDQRVYLADAAGMEFDVVVEP
jgi:ABC-type branched-subunit amino acid transport system substrate-binding protein